MTSWAQATEERFMKLAEAGASVDLLVSGFEQVTREWSQLPRDGRRPFASGITDDGSPVEVSLRVSADDASPRARFIAQPGRPVGGSALDLELARTRALEFVGHWSGDRAISFVGPLLELLEPSPAFTGSFLLWLGLEQDGPDGVKSKLYVNPWTFEEARGALLLDVVLRASGLGSALPGLELATSAHPGLRLQIVGINLDEHGVEAVKAYFVLDRARARDVIALAALFDSDEPLARTLAVLDPDASGQVHAALVWRRGGIGPRFRASLYCPHWFHSSRELLDVARTLLDEHRASILFEPALEHHSHTFCGVEPDGLTLYSKV